MKRIYYSLSVLILFNFCQCTQYSDEDRITLFNISLSKRDVKKGLHSYRVQVINTTEDSVYVDRVEFIDSDVKVQSLDHFLLPRSHGNMFILADSTAYNKKMRMYFHSPDDKWHDEYHLIY